MWRVRGAIRGIGRACRIGGGRGVRLGRDVGLVGLLFLLGLRVGDPKREGEGKGEGELPLVCWVWLTCEPSWMGLSPGRVPTQG